MARTCLAVLAAAGALLLSGAAQAKAPPGGIDVCGTTGCVHLAWADSEQFWIRSHTPDGAVRPGPFYVLRWSWGGSTQESAYYVPSTRSVRWNSGEGHPAAWTGVEAQGAASLKQAVGTIEPYTPPAPTRATIGGRVVRAPGGYLALLSGKRTWLVPGVVGWLRVTIEADTLSPWTDGSSEIRLSKRSPYLMIDGWVYRIPKAIAARARKGLPLINRAAPAGG